MSMAAFVAAMFFAGHQFSEWMWARSARAPLSALERISSSALLGIVFWLATTWALALTFRLQAGPLLVCATAAVLGGIVLRRKAQGAAPDGRGRTRSPAPWSCFPSLHGWDFSCGAATYCRLTRPTR